MTRIFHRSARSTDFISALEGAAQQPHRPSGATMTATLIAAAVLVLAGCAGEGGSPSRPVISATPSATPTATPLASPTVACPESESQGPWGDVIATEQVSDAAGSYCHTALDPAAAAAQFDVSVVDLESLATYGFTIEDAEAAHQAALSYVAGQGLDSSRLDEYSMADSAWFDTAKDAFSPAAQERFAPLVEAYGLRDAGVIITQSLPPLSRVGGPRATTTAVSVDKIYGTLDLDQVTPLLVVRTRFTTAYPAADAAIVDAAIRNERGTAVLTEDALRNSTPSLFDGSDEEGLVLDGGFNVGFGTGDMAAIAYISSVWSLTTGDGALQIDAVEPEVDPSQR
ncbi:hypothetical protein E3O42_16315 [Cryobacterium adonitolivorans]|uniref:Uncharacterized protein n=1 Tax=Cryobacterium adonitolivorans TaxID=1259189 RepID=A0A4R8W149_9MICO|nr:hypothetical protein [Cryobacterium adonitolivorans]TFB97500.1 hypothetical protein E3O42_16315 [Cryobacterium adonitolivorans]